MALDAYLRIVGATQGAIEGDVDRQGLEGAIAVHSWSWSARDPRSRRREGRGDRERRTTAEPVVIVKHADRSTPLLLAALVAGERLTSCSLMVYEPDETGAETLVQVIALDGARIESVAAAQLDNRSPDAAASSPSEEITIAYDELVVTHEPSGNSATVDLGR